MNLAGEAVVVREGYVWHVRISGARKTLCGIEPTGDIYDPTILERQCRKCSQLAGQRCVVVGGVVSPESQASEHTESVEGGN